MDTGNIQLTSIDTHFTAQAQKRALKYPLREVEETEKGHYVAYADDGPESFDVQLWIEKGEVKGHSCDCGKLDAQGFCPHQLALLMQLATQKTNTAKQVTKRKVKEDPLTTLLNQTDTEDLKKWLKEVLQQQKDLAIAFTNRFSPRPADYTLEEIQKITDAAVRSVVKNKKKIDQSELKKIIQLWKEVHDPVINHYLSGIASVDSIELFSTLLLSIQTWHQSFNINSTKIDTYKKDVFARTIQPLYEIENEEVWKSVISGYFGQGFKAGNAAAADWLSFLSNLVKFQTSPSRVDYILEGFKGEYLAIKSKKGTFVTDFFTQLVFNTYKAAGRTRDCIKWIMPISYNNTFNLELIDALILHDFDTEAEVACRTIIKSNTHISYSIPYLKRLSGLYKKSLSLRQKLYPVLLEMLPLEGGLEDYLILKDEYFKNREEDFKKWRIKLMNSLGHSIHSSIHAAHFYFDILHHEGKFTKMLEKIREVSTVEVALKYFEVLFSVNKTAFLDGLSSISPGFYHNTEDHQFYAPLSEKVKQHYTPYEIRQVIIKKEYYWKGEFAKYCEKTMVLGEENIKRP